MKLKHINTEISQLATMEAVNMLSEHGKEKLEEFRYLKKLHESKVKNLGLFGVSRFYSAGAKAKQRFEKEMLELNNVLGKNVEADERVSELIDWYRKECSKRPEIYKGDEIVVNAIKQGALKGLNFSFSLMEAYRILKANFAFTDNMRAMG